MADLGSYSQLLQQDPSLMESLQSRYADPQAPAPIDPAVLTRTSGQSNVQQVASLNDRMANQGDVGQSFLREGESASAGAAKKAQEQQESAARAQAMHAQAAQRVMQNRELMDSYRKKAEADLSAATEEPHGMAKWGPMLMGIVGAAAQAGGDQGTAQGLGMLSQVIGRSAQEKAQRAQTAFDGHNTMFRQAMGDTQNELDATTKLMGQEHEVAARRLDQFAQEAAVPALREQALRLAQGARDEGLKMRQSYYAAMGAQQLGHEEFQANQGRMTREAAASKPKEIEMQLSELLKKESDGSITVPEYKTLLALKNGAADLDKKNAPAEAGGKLSADQEKIQSVLAGAADPYSRINKLVASGGEGANWKPGNVDTNSRATKWLPDFARSEGSVQEDADVEALVNTVLRAESGGAIGKDEVSGKIRGLGLDSGDEAVRARGLKELLSQVSALDKTGQLAKAPGEASSDQPSKAAARYAKYKVKK